MTRQELTDQIENSQHVDNINAIAELIYKMGGEALNPVDYSGVSDSIYVTFGLVVDGEDECIEFRFSGHEPKHNGHDWNYNDGFNAAWNLNKAISKI